MEEQTFARGSGAWKKLETYIRTHTQANFSHGICPECLERTLIGDIDNLEQK